MSINRACRRRNRQLRRKKSSPKCRNSPEDYSGESNFSASGFPVGPAPQRNLSRKESLRGKKALLTAWSRSARR